MLMHTFAEAQSSLAAIKQAQSHSYVCMWHVGKASPGIEKVMMKRNNLSSLIFGYL